MDAFGKFYFCPNLDDYSIFRTVRPSRSVFSFTSAVIYLVYLNVLGHPLLSSSCLQNKIQWAGGAYLFLPCLASDFLQGLI